MDFEANARKLILEVWEHNSAMPHEVYEAMEQSVHPNEPLIKHMLPQVSAALIEAWNEGYSDGIGKGRKIASEHKNNPLRNDAYRAACSEIMISCEATINRLKRGEHEDSTTEVGSIKKAP